MKKLSVSLFAVLAIAFAISSAFTTKSSKTVSQWFLENTSNFTTGDAIADDIASYSSTAYTETGDDNDPRTGTIAPCPGGSTIVCAAQFDASQVEEGQVEVDAFALYSN